jgi:uncharacterized protein
MKMFTAKEEKNLSYVLSKSADEESMLLLEELHGLLFGLAITPEPIMPSEWLPAIFDDEPQFDDDKDAQICIGYLMAAYNRIIHDSNSGKLTFPFNMNKLSDFEYSLIEGWTYGLFLALSLRPHIWGITEKNEDLDEKDLPDDIQDVIDSCSIIIAIALPDERDEIFTSLPDHPQQNPKEFEATLYSMLPLVVETLQEHGAKIREGGPDLDDVWAPPEEKLTAKAGRNDPCPCGSGKKYKKCCGNN